MENIFENIPDKVPQEIFDDIVSSDKVLIERIVSEGQNTPLGKWLVQDKDEWVILLKGGAEIVFEDTGKSFNMVTGDHIYIKKRRRHRVNSTVSDQKTVWLAVHF